MQLWTTNNSLKLQASFSVFYFFVIALTNFPFTSATFQIKFNAMVERMEIKKKYRESQEIAGEWKLKGINFCHSVERLGVWELNWLNNNSYSLASHFFTHIHTFFLLCGKINSDTHVRYPLSWLDGGRDGIKGTLE